MKININFFISFKMISMNYLLVFGVACLVGMLLGEPLLATPIQQTGSNASFSLPRRDDPTSNLPNQNRRESDMFGREERVRGIQQRIDTLKDVLSKRQQLTNEEESSETESEVAPTVKAPTVSGSRKLPFNLPGLETHANPETIESEIQPEVGDRNEISPEDLLLHGIPAVTSPVNSLELANSLFLTKNYSQALRSYENLLTTEDSVIDQDWLRLLAANCYRIQRKVGVAEQLYRDVAASKQKSFPSDHAKWYLNHLTRRKALEAEIEQINNELLPYGQKGGTR